MKYEQAIRLLDPETTREALAEIEYYGGFNGKEACIKAIDDACRLAVEALKKQIPLKIQPKKSKRSPSICGKCGEVMELAQGTLKYCPNCGQAIDFGGTKNDTRRKSNL